MHATALGRSVRRGRVQERSALDRHRRTRRRGAEGIDRLADHGQRRMPNQSINQGRGGICSTYHREETSPYVQDGDAEMTKNTLRTYKEYIRFQCLQRKTRACIRGARAHTHTHTPISASRFFFPITVSVTIFFFKKIPHKTFYYLLATFTYGRQSCKSSAMDPLG